MQWEINSRLREKTTKQRKEEIIKTLLKNRGIFSKEKIKRFLNPAKPETLTPEEVGIKKTQVSKAINRIKKAIQNQESIIVYGDYDADGICSAAILWEALHAIGAQALPFIPHREKHGYGLSIKGIDDILNKSTPTLIITVDNGIVAHEAVNYARKKGIDVIICDHHEKSSKTPKALAIIHTTKLAGSGVAWIFAKEISRKFKTKTSTVSSLDLVTIGTIADMVPLVESNRSIVKFGLKALQNSQRRGIQELFKEAAIDPDEVRTYQINFIIAPRLNAAGRLEHALDALRLLCTKNKNRAKSLALKLGTTNRRRQKLTEEMLTQAKEIYSAKSKQDGMEKIIIIEHQDFHEGIIGLIAGKMVEEFYRPTIVLSRGKRVSKASARSITGFNIIEAIRRAEHLLIDAGGHPMAAGFTIESTKIETFKTSFRNIADKTIDLDLLKPTLNIDCLIELSDITWELYRQIEKLEPFGIGNPRPKFALESCKLINARAVGSEQKHLKLTIGDSGKVINGIGFNLGFLNQKLEPGTTVSLAFTLEKNVWDGREELQLKIKDVKS
jgi:single-stranded-DNA-specific exonuclease